MKNKLTTLSFRAGPARWISGWSLSGTRCSVENPRSPDPRVLGGGRTGHIWCRCDFQIFGGHLNSLLEGGRMLLEQRAEI